jgi:hypothetical protein
MAIFCKDPQLLEVIFVSFGHAILVALVVLGPVSIWMSAELPPGVPDDLPYPSIKSAGPINHGN